VISYTVRRNMPAKDSSGFPCKVALAFIRFPDGTGTTMCIPEGLLATVPDDKRDDFIAHEIETTFGLSATRQ
jgi:hypothetical protein